MGGFAMKLSHVWLGLLLLATPAIAAESIRPAQLDGPSIFSRVRGIKDGGIGIPPVGRVTPAPRFVGTFSEQDRVVAFLEVQTPAGSRLITLAAGDIISWDQSRVLEITSDHLQLSSPSGQPRIIAIGYNLQNQPDGTDAAALQPPTRPLAPGRIRQGPSGLTPR
jgi:hypothetical protein